MENFKEKPEEKNAEQFIQEFLEDIPKGKKEITEYALRNLITHLKEGGDNEEEIQKKLDEIGFPKELR